MAWATVEQWLARVDAKIAHDLTVEPDSLVPSPDVTKIGNALDDATAELEGFLPRIAEAHRPGDATKRIHCIKVATYLLSIGKSGKEYETIRNAYTDTIAFYTGLVEQTASQMAQPPAGVAAVVPAPVFTSDTLKGLV